MIALPDQTAIDDIVARRTRIAELLNEARKELDAIGNLIPKAPPFTDTLTQVHRQLNGLSIHVHSAIEMQIEIAQLHGTVVPKSR